MNYIYFAADDASDKFDSTDTLQHFFREFKYNFTVVVVW